MAHALTVTDTRRHSRQSLVIFCDFPIWQEKRQRWFGVLKDKASKPENQKASVAQSRVLSAKKSKKREV